MDRDAVRTAILALPEVRGERWWGRRLAAVRVAFGAIPAELLEELVLEAWASKAPASVLRAHDAQRRP
jgi:hypothetical protein